MKKGWTGCSWTYLTCRLSDPYVKENIAQAEHPASATTTCKIVQKTCILDVTLRAYRWRQLDSQTPSPESKHRRGAIILTRPGIWGFCRYEYPWLDKLEPVVVCGPRFLNILTHLIMSWSLCSLGPDVAEITLTNCVF